MIVAQDYAEQAADVFVLPDAVTKIKQLIDDDTADMSDIAAVIQFDPALTSQVLKIANSALYKFPSKIENISKALQVIGTNSIYDLVIGYGVAKAFNKIDAEVIDLDRFWEQSVQCGVLAKYLADKKRIRDSERLFVAGLLHNIGELVMIRFNPTAARACAEYNETHTPLDLQQKELGITYAEIGAKLIETWGIPSNIFGLIEQQHASLHPSDDIAVQIMQLSYTLALDNVNQAFYPANANLDPAMMECLNLESEDLQTAIDHTNMQALSVFAIFNPSAMNVP